MLRPARHKRLPVPRIGSHLGQPVFLLPLTGTSNTLLAGLIFGAYHSGLFLRSISKRVYGSLDSLSASSAFKVGLEQFNGDSDSIVNVLDEPTGKSTRTVRWIKLPCN